MLSSSGLPLVGLIALILATWTTNVSNAYSGGLSLSVLLGQDEKKSQMTTAIAGIIGTMIADYWILGKGSAENFRMREGFYAPGLISFLAGAFIACVTGGTFASIPFLSFLNFPFFIGPVNGIVVAMLVYLILAKAGKKEG